MSRLHDHSERHSTSRIGWLRAAVLFRMVRRLTGFQVAIGQGLIEPQAMLECLESETKSLVQYLAPPQGLTLVEVIYRADLVR